MLTTELFTIDGSPMPFGEVSLCIEDVVSADSGLDESGVLHRFPLRQGVKSWDFSFSRLDGETYGYLEDLFAGKNTFSFGYESRQSVTAYRSKCSVLWHSEGQFRDCKFRITTC